MNIQNLYTEYESLIHEKLNKYGRKSKEYVVCFNQNMSHKKKKTVKILWTCHEKKTIVSHRKTP